MGLRNPTEESTEDMAFRRMLTCADLIIFLKVNFFGIPIIPSALDLARL